MYQLEYLPIAVRDMSEIVRYISKELKSPVAAETLSNAFIDGAENLQKFPYAYPTYTPIRPLKHEYRKLLIQHYLMLYWVDEETKLVTVARVVYAKREYGNLLK